MAALRHASILFFLAIVSSGSAAFTFMRYGQTYVIDDPLPKTLEDFVNRARDEAKDPTIARFFTMNGRPIQAVEDLPNSAIALDFEEHFFWPFIAPGYKHDVSTVTDKPDLELISLADSPRLFEIKNFLTEEECDLIVSLAAKQGLDDSGLILDPGVDPTLYIGTRTSKGTFLDYYSNPVLRRVAERAANLTAVPAHHSEDMQVLHYDPMTHYYAHHDWIGYEANEERQHWASVRKGYYDDNRFITLVLYLNDVESGGHTSFPYTNPNFRMDDTENNNADLICKEEYPCIKVKPKKGNAAMFYDLLERTHMMGDPDMASMHAGCDPVKGADKWAANFWIHTWPWRDAVPPRSGDAYGSDEEGKEEEVDEVTDEDARLWSFACMHSDVSTLVQYDNFAEIGEDAEEGSYEYVDGEADEDEEGEAQAGREEYAEADNEPIACDDELCV